MPTVLRVYGDSHARYFLNSNRFLYGRLGIGPDLPTIDGQAIQAASVAGFRPGKSSLNTKEIIQGGIDGADLIVLAFGQVDLELGYYYRKVVKREAGLDPASYPQWLAGIYFDFVDSLGVPPERLAIKGVNLTVLTERTFTERYARRIVLKEGEEKGQRRALREAILSEAEQNAMSLSYNALLRKECEAREIRYFDINASIARHEDGEIAGIASRYCPAGLDHHLVDSLDVRRYHIDALASLVA